MNTLVKGLRFVVEIVEKLFKMLFGSGFSKMIDKLTEFITGLQMYIQFWGIYIDYIFAKLKANIIGIKEELMSMVEFFKPITKFIGYVWRIGKSKEEVEEMRRSEREWAEAWSKSPEGKKTLQKAERMKDLIFGLPARTAEDWYNVNRQIGGEIKNYLKRSMEAIEKLNNKLDEEKIVIKKKEEITDAASGGAK
jgi:hypothetical protein